MSYCVSSNHLPLRLPLRPRICNQSGTPSASDGIDFVPGTALPQDPGNLTAERGPSTFDTRQRFTAALNYALPSFSSNRRLGSGWQLNTVGSPLIVPNPGAHLYGDLTQSLLPMAPITQTPDIAQTNPGLGGGGPRVFQLGAKFVF